MEVRNLSYRYADQTLALDQVNLKLHRHERLALMGSNGSGKSTLFLNLNGVYRPTGGQILYQDKPLDYSRKSASGWESSRCGTSRFTSSAAARRSGCPSPTSW